MDPRASRERRRGRGPALLLAAALGVAACGDGSTDLDAAPSSTPPAAASTNSTPSAATSRSTAVRAGNGGVTEYGIEIVATHPHDTEAYTQGLEMVGDLLLETTGLEGRSSVRLLAPRSGGIVRSSDLDPELFGEGATVVGDEVWQLTWRDGTLLVHGLDDLEERRRIGYEGEGWGLCATDDRLIMSDGSERLLFRDRRTFELLDSVTVVDGTTPVGRLNELECVGDLVWANVYQTTRLLAIDPSDGRVVGTADLSDLVPPGFEDSNDAVANGIAHDPTTGRFWLTGKLWPVLYEVELVPVS